MARTVVFKWNPVSEDSSVNSELVELFRQLNAKGVNAMTYHLTAPFYSQISKRTSVFHAGYPKKIINIYLDPEIFESDPIPDHVMAAGHVMTWRQAIAGQKLTARHRKYVKEAVRLGFVDGVAVPLFGPMSRNAAAGRHGAILSQKGLRDHKPDQQGHAGPVRTRKRGIILDFSRQIERGYGDHIGNFRSHD